MTEKIEFKVLEKGELFRILRELKTRLREIYKDRLKKLILYGSYARGDATPESDIDLLMVLDDFNDRWDEVTRTEDIVAEICLEHDLLIALTPVRESTFANNKDTSFVTNVMEEGKEI